jgi:lactate dehydrogenase-like 2-hydroxyacid dehydrogenase
MKIVLLDAQTLGEDLDLSPLEGFGSLSTYATTTPEQTAERIAGAQIVITNKVVIDAALMDATPSLRLICIAATGMNNVDLKYAQTKGVSVRNVAGYSTQSVVQHTFAMALYLLEKLPYYERQVTSKAWSHSGLFTDIGRPFCEIAGKQWGIIGMGEIGRSVAQVATAFGATVCYHSTSGTNTAQPYPHFELDALLARCEFVSIHAPLNDQTKHLINRTNLSLLQEGAILLNLGRGGIIDEEDLAEALEARNFYAGLDVTEREPIPADHPLLTLRNPERLLLTPHIAWTSIEARTQLLEGILSNIRTFLDA